MNKTELIEKVAFKTKSTKTSTARMLNAILGVVGDAIGNNEDVVLSDFGHFSKAYAPTKVYSSCYWGACCCPLA